MSKLINMRVPPLSNALDYEAFITEFGGALENDNLRDLLLFPRDDVAVKIEIDVLIPITSF